MCHALLNMSWCEWGDAIASFGQAHQAMLALHKIGCFADSRISELCLCNEGLAKGRLKMEQTQGAGSAVFDMRDSSSHGFDQQLQ